MLYKHFSGMEDIVASVAVQGFGELAERPLHGARRAADGRDALARVAHAFIGFARDNPALFDAMFTRATTLPFAAAGHTGRVTAAFAELRAAVDTVAGTAGSRHAGRGGVGIAARPGHPRSRGRLRPDYHAERVDTLIAGLVATT